jgi:hypothetical protein
MKIVAAVEDKLLACVPEKWAFFYKNAPKKFNADYITAAGYTREEFLELAEATKFFDYSDYENTEVGSVYKDYEYVHPDCKSWFLNEREMALYDAMPEEFSEDELRKTRLVMGLPISSQDKMLEGTLFHQTAFSSKDGLELKKGLIRPTYKH